jgi:sulfonate dioxygenase
VRTHPATGEKALYVNPQFTRYIVGFKQEESDYLLKFLYDHIALSQDLQARVKWKAGTVVVWDNRVTGELSKRVEVPHGIWLTSYSSFSPH